MKTEALKLYECVRDSHATSYAALQQLKATASRVVDQQELADIAYVLHECEKFVKDQEKECRKAREIIERAVCILWVQASVAEPIRTHYVTASPEVKVSASLPDRRRDPENFRKLMTSLCIPPELWDVGPDDSAVVQPHWPGVMQYVSALAEQGKPLPDGIDPGKTFSVYKLRYHKRKELPPRTESV